VGRGERLKLLRASGTCNSSGKHLRGAPVRKKAEEVQKKFRGETGKPTIRRLSSGTVLDHGTKVLVERYGSMNRKVPGEMERPDYRPARGREAKSQL